MTENILNLSNEELLVQFSSQSAKKHWDLTKQLPYDPDPNRVAIHPGLFRNKKLTRIEGLFLFDVIDIGYADYPEKEGEWFPCTKSRLHESMRWTGSQQKRIIKKLKDRGYIDSRRIGLPPVRHIKIIFDKIKKDMLP